ncbi:uncharacterized protein LOC128390881 [Panonychus citri]|uniref:uncharacterized protein LOC128390881 n=1 Tax=Panonychus citri TaxID=50023 RepID=UPI002306EA8B|nr:uncharacterized protein LOC128390881 [Panonychus citri]XP_053206631.1 uncharacterized protein LOC128390881 [Panonychus citri]
MLFSRLSLVTSRHVYRALVNSNRSAHYANPYAKWHPSGVALIPAHHSPDPYTLDPEKIAKDHHHTLHGVPREFWPATLNEFPVPSGSWAEHYAEVQSAYNKQLAIGIVFFLISVGVFVSHPKIFWYSPPLDITDLNWRDESSE